MNRRPKQILVVFLTMLLAAMVIAGGWVGSAVAQDEVNPGGQGSEAIVPLVEFEFTCTIVNITAYTNRIHVRCAMPNPTGITYFAAANDEANIRVTNQFLTLLNTAYAMGTNVGLRFEASSASNPPGCAVSDCRKLIGVFITK